MQVAVADITADFAFFKSFDTTRGNTSFPFPPRTALMGMIAGILGLKRNSYWNGHTLSNTLFGLEIINPIKRKGIKMNYTQSRKTMLFDRKIRILLPAKPHVPEARGFTTQVRIDMLQDVAYRIFIANENIEIFKKICFALENKKYCYPPYMGHANLLCNIYWKGLYDFKPNTNPLQNVHCLIPTSLIEKNILHQFGYFNLILKVPMEYKSYSVQSAITKENILKIEPIRYENVIFQLRSEKGIQITLKNLNFSYVGNVDSYKTEIIFFPPHSVKNNSIMDN